MDENAAEAADELGSLRANIAELLEALRPFIFRFGEPPTPLDLYRAGQVYDRIAQENGRG